MSDDHRGKVLPIPPKKLTPYIEANSSRGTAPIKWRPLMDCKWHILVDAVKFYNHTTIKPQLDIIRPVVDWAPKYKKNFSDRFSSPTVEAVEIRVQPTSAFRSRFRNSPGNDTGHLNRLRRVERLLRWTKSILQRKALTEPGPAQPQNLALPTSLITRTFFEGRHRTRYVVEFVKAAEMVISIRSTREIYDDRMPIGTWDDNLTEEYDKLVYDEVQKYDFFIRFEEPKYM